jgi:4-hydroxy-tetrahydrodipicolinate reductase
MNAPLKILINGARGRMGQALLALAPEAGAEVVAALDLGDDPGPGLAACAVAIDFSHADATAALAEAAAAAGKALVIGTTGHAEPSRARILAAAGRIPIVWTGNYSIGVNLLFHLARTAATALGPGYHAEIVELHHSHKKDAPSGTALNLADAIRSAPGFAGAPLRHGRAGQTGERDPAEIGMHALRGGEIVGEHTVHFIGPHDRIELSHRAADRGIFARGALQAARWVAGRAPGLYDMRDVMKMTDD